MVDYHISDRHLFVPDREILLEIQGEKLSLKELFAKILRTKSNGLAYAPFLAALLLFSAGKQSLVRTSSQNYIETGHLKTLILKLSAYWVLEFQALTDLCAEINVRLANSIFANHKRARLDMKKQEEQISKKNMVFLMIMSIIRISLMMLLLKKKVIFLMMIMMMFLLNKEVIMKLKKLMIGKQFPTRLQKGKVKMKLMKKYIKSQF